MVAGGVAGDLIGLAVGSLTAILVLILDVLFFQILNGSDIVESLVGAARLFGTRLDS